MRSKLMAILGVTAAWSAISCGAGDGGGPEPGTLSLRVALSAGQHDVTAVRVDIVAADAECSSEPLFTQTVAFETEELPEALAGSGSHRFASGSFVLAPGEYRVCAAPLAGDQPSEECGAAEALAAVVEGTTADVTLLSQCGGDDNGGLGVVVALNDRPKIEQLTLDPAGFISVCESAHLSATASDANDDELTYLWSVDSGPEGASLRSEGSTATFSGPPGEYTLSLLVDDGHGGTSSLAFPMRVSDAVCEVPEAVQEIFSTRCSPCHTTGSSGGLRLDPASASFANLVNLHSSSAACGSRVRVVPGDSASSYLIAKLLGEPGICGQRMPRNAPPLPEEEVATIAAWIDSLPH